MEILRNLRKLEKGIEERGVEGKMKTQMWHTFGVAVSEGPSFLLGHG